MSDLTQIISRIEAGDPSAAESLLPLVYGELRRLAEAKLRNEPHEHTLQPTALVHEAYLRLIKPGTSPKWNGRGHFFAAAAEAMRRILVDNARRRRTTKHGGGLNRVELVDQAQEAKQSVDVVALSEALDDLAMKDPRKAELVKLRYFVGFTIHEAAEALSISDSTADSDWAYAKSWLKVHLRET